MHSNGSVTKRFNDAEYCCVRGCSNISPWSAVTFFKLPAAVEKRSTWLTLIKREDLNTRFWRQNRICEAHFTPDSIQQKNDKKVLKRCAIPLLLPSPSISKESENTEIEVGLENKSAFTDMAEKQLVLELPLKGLALKRIATDELESETKRIKLEAEAQNSRHELNCGGIVAQPNSLDEITYKSSKKRRRPPSNKVWVSKCETSTMKFNKLCDKLLDGKLAELVKEQAQLKQHSNGNRYSVDFKVFCLNLFYVSPLAYKFMRDTLCLPSSSQLKRKYMPITTKIESHLIEVLKLKVEQMVDIDRNCSLVIDTIKLKENIIYHPKEDRFYGFHEIDGRQTPEPAKFALVAMIQGLFEDYKQPVGYALLANGKPYDALTEWLDKLIQRLFDIGLNVRVLSDCTDFLNYNTRSVTIENPYFLVEGTKIFYMFHPPYLITNMRDNLMVNNFEFGTHVAKWSYIIQFHNSDKTKELRIAKDLTDSHLEPKFFQNRSNVKLAQELFSRTVAAGISTYVDFDAIDQEANGTVKLITTISDLFDLFNSSDLQGATKFQNAFSGEDYQVEFLNDTLKLFASLKLIKNDRKANRNAKPMFVEGFQITIKSLLLLFEDLKLEGHKYLLTKRLYQDCLQNYFGRARRQSCWKLISGFRKKFCLNILKPSKRGQFCTDLAKMLLNFEGLFSNDKNEEDSDDYHCEKNSDRGKKNAGDDKSTEVGGIYNVEIKTENSFITAEESVGQCGTDIVKTEEFFTHTGFLINTEVPSNSANDTELISSIDIDTFKSIGARSKISFEFEPYNSGDESEEIISRADKNKKLDNHTDRDMRKGLAYNQERNGSIVPSIGPTEYNKLGLPETDDLVYISGYLLRKCFAQHKCGKLLSYITDSGLIDENFTEDKIYASYVNYAKDKGKILLVPKEDFLLFVKMLQVNYKNLFAGTFKGNIIKLLLDGAQSLTFQMPCECFPLQYCKTLFFRVIIFYSLRANNLAFSKSRDRTKLFAV